MKRQRGTGSIFLQPGSSIWWYQIWVNGKRERGSTGWVIGDGSAPNLLATVRLYMKRSKNENDKSNHRIAIIVKNKRTGDKKIKVN